LTVRWLHHRKFVDVLLAAEEAAVPADFLKTLPDGFTEPLRINGNPLHHQVEFRERRQNQFSGILV
jgi:hypothetical protein